MHTIRSIRRGVVLSIAVGALLAGAGCKKKSGGPPGGSWLVGEAGLMTNLLDDGTLGDGYDLESEHDLLDIVCRGADTAFVVGEQGTMLRTFDGGESWESIDLGATGTLRSVATAGPAVVLVAGDGTLQRSADSGATWTALATDPQISWLAVAGDHDGGAVALTASGTVWRYPTTGAGAAVGELVGARAIAASHDGYHVAVVGAGSSVLRSDDAGASWRTVSIGSDLELRAAWVTEAGDLIAVGDGTVLRASADDQIQIGAPTTATLRTLHINGAGHGLAAGDAGTVLMTHDMGATWTALDLGLTGTVFGVDEVDGHGHL
jgi:photosystem II stability/assembly factor-like uncharacterized protein